MLQPGEMLVILLLALVVLGPERLPAVARKLGKWVADLKLAATEIRQGIESELSDLKDPADEIQESIAEIRDTMRRAGPGLEEVGLNRLAWQGPKPVSGPTPADAMRDLELIEAELTAEEE